ncbi:toprim domain-containing protein [Phenylobacterium sp.]|uniref:toprim domain-containing protein n=1 Tax=Phenylobacterium sp. TaxID=1871053 RepID=UPI0035AFE811
MRAADIARARRGVPSGDGFLVSCPLASHGKGRGDRRPSLSIRDGDTALLVHCHAGCDPRDVLEALRREGHADGDAPPETQERPSLQRAEPEHRPDPAAVTIWREAVTRGEILGRYLAGRGIRSTPPTLRQGIHLKFGRIPIPCMVAAVQAPSGQVIAVQETLLTWKATKAPLTSSRHTTGALGHGAVRLGPAGPVLGVAEGVETALSAMELSGVTCWASLGGQRLGRIALPSAVREVHIFADADAPGRAAAEMAADRYAQQGLAVTVRWPPEPFGDWNDYHRGQAGAAAA